MQSDSHEKVSKLENALHDANKLLRTVESCIASKEAAQQDLEEQVQKSRDEAQDLRSKLGSASSHLKAADAKLLEQAEVGTKKVDDLEAKLGQLNRQLQASGDRANNLQVGCMKRLHLRSCILASSFPTQGWRS